CVGPGAAAAPPLDSLAPGRAGFDPVAGGHVCTKDSSGFGAVAPSRWAISGGPSGRGPGPSGPQACPSKEPYDGRIPGALRAAHPLHMPQGTLPLSGRVRVLVVDDNEGFRGSLAALLGGEDLEVVGQASNGIEAI